MAKKSAAAKKKNSAPKAERQKTIEIKSVRLGRKSISIAWQQGEAKFDLSERDNPLPKFYPAFTALASVAGTICHFPKKYSEEGMRVVGIEMGEKGGVETVAVICRKDIDDAAKEFAFKTPARMLAHPVQEGKYTPPLSKEDVELVKDAIEQAKAYIKGERAQGQIEFEKKEGDDEGDEDAETAEFPELAEEGKK